MGVKQQELGEKLVIGNFWLLFFGQHYRVCAQFLFTFTGRFLYGFSWLLIMIGCYIKLPCRGLLLFS